MKQSAKGGKMTVNELYFSGDSDYDSEVNDEIHGDEDICRCQTIRNFRINSVDVNEIVRSLSSGLKNVDDKYCVDRIVRHYEIYDTSKWSASAQRGYYGEELGRIQFKDESIVKETILKAINLKTTTEKINFLLTLEYGYVLERLKNVKWKLITIKRSDILARQREYAKKIRNEEYYANYELPVAIIDDELGIVDGYHRVAASRKDTVDVYMAIKQRGKS